MLVIKIKPFINIDGINHIATTWEIATDKEFTNIVETVRSETYINAYQSDITVPEGDIYWVRAKRHFTEPNLDKYTEPSRIIANGSDITTMILEQDLIIEAPIVYIDEDRLRDMNQPDFNVTTSKFRSEVEEHKATHWIIRNGDGKLLFTSMFDTKNLTSINIVKNNEIKRECEFEVIAIHVGATGVESQVGKAEVVTIGFLFDILTPLREVQPYIDLVIEFKTKREDGKLGIYSVDLIDPGSEKMLMTTIVKDDGRVTIPWNFLTYNSSFYLDVHALNSKDIYTVSRNLITTRMSQIRPIESINFAYEEKLTTHYDKPIDGIDYKKSVSTMEIPAGYVPYPKQDSLQLYKFTINHKTGLIEPSNNAIPGVNLLSPNPDHMNIRFTADDILIVDTTEVKNGITYPVFCIYAYLRARDTYTLVKAIKREDESRSTGWLNNLVQYSPTEFYYIPYGIPEIRRLDINTNTVTRVIDLPNELFAKACMMYIPNSKLLIMGKDERAWIYDVEEKELTKSITILPKSFRTKEIRQILLPNGDSLMYKLIDDAMAEPTIVVDEFGNTNLIDPSREEIEARRDKETGILKFEYKNKGFVSVNREFPQFLYPQSSVLLMDNRVLLLDYVAPLETIETKYVGATKPGVYAAVYS